MSFQDTLFRIIRDAVRSTLGPRPATRRSRRHGSSYPGDFVGRPNLRYEPHPDDIADPGEVAWTWVPYEEDHTKGKDRPVLIIGRDGPWLLALQLTSKDHDHDAAQEARAGRYWIDVGSGNWDRRRRPSEARVNRIIRISPSDIRRASVKLPKSVFDEVAKAVLAHAPRQSS